MTKRLMAKTGEYQKDGQTKGRYTEIGVILSNANGEYVLLDPSVNLAGVLMQQQAMGKQGDRVMVSIFENRTQQNQEYSQQQYSAPPQRDLEDEIPW